MTASLRQLASLYEVHASYDDFSKRRTHASAEAVMETLRLLGAPIQSAADVPDAARERRQQLWKQVVEPVAVARPQRFSSVEVRLPAARGAARARCSMRLEDGTEAQWVCDLGRGANTRSQDVEGVRYLSQRVRLPFRLPVGYHELTVDGAGSLQRCRVIVAPVRAFASAGLQWGAFLPLYALHTSQSWGAGDFSDLEQLQDWVGRQGGSFVSILPVLAAHGQAPFDPSPYAPSSRLFWNEFYVDPRRAPELAECPRVQRLLASPGFRGELATLRSAPMVDYERQRALRRGVLAELARWLAETRNDRYTELLRYAASRPSVEDYARFAAVLEKRQVPWPDWPEPLRSGAIGREEHDQEIFFYHLYVQWLAEQQLAAITSPTAARPGLYLDLPLGVHAHGYDTWRHRDAFALGACGGSPPDPVFTRGQDWQFPPLHPEGIRAQGYAYLIDCLRHQLGHASSLRIDHVMGLHRLYWIPRGWPASEGVYVRYRSEELYAILCLESHRHRATLVGENLGTVPTYVNAALSRHGIQQMYVIQYEALPRGAGPLRRIPADSVASVNTHDMPPFAAYLRELDLRDRVTLGLLPTSQLRREQRNRRLIRSALIRFLRQQRCLSSTSERDSALMRASLAWLAKSAAAVVLVNLEDLWLETEPQNLPGTGLERPNWRRRARYALEQLAAQPGVVKAVRLFASEREKGKGRW